MVSRREFLRAGSIAGLSSLVPGGAVLASQREVLPQAPYEAVADTRFPEGDLFLSAVAGTAYRIHGAGGDAGRLLSTLPVVFSDKRCLVGLAPDATFMVVLQLAMEQGYQLNYQGVHVQEDDHTVRHTLLGERRWIPRFGESLAQARGEWAGRVGDFASGLAVPARSTEEVIFRSETSRLAQSPGRLISWALIPPVA